MATETSVYDGLKQLLPKLAQPSWVHLIGLQVQPPVAFPLDKKAEKRAARARHKRSLRLASAVFGAHTRNTKRFAGVT